MEFATIIVHRERRNENGEEEGLRLYAERNRPSLLQVCQCRKFAGWFQRVIRIFFDEVHTVKEAKAVIDGDSAEARVVVQGEANVWNPPSAKSERIIADAYQTWKMKPSDGKPVITKYVVDKFEYHEGSARL